MITLKNGGFVHRQFKREQRVAVPLPELAERLAATLEALNEQEPGGYPRPAHTYLTEWADERHRWGDLDAQGFLILSRLRSLFPHVTSLMMSWETFSTFADYCVESTPAPSGNSRISPLKNMTYLSTLRSTTCAWNRSVSAIAMLCVLCWHRQVLMVCFKRKADAGIKKHTPNV